MITAALLAAGETKRTGPLLKPLLPVNGKTVIETVIEKLKESDVDRIVVVLGYEAGKIEEAIKDEDIDVLINKEYKKGMLSSVKHGIKSDLNSNFLICMVDQPLIDVKTINTIINHYDSSRVVVPTYKGKRGHPILIPSSLIKELIFFEGKTLRDFVHGHEIKEVEIDDEGIIINLNTIEDFKKYLGFNGILWPYF